MREAKEVMDKFMETWENMKKYQNIGKDLSSYNFDELETTFKKERKIIKTYEPSEIEEKEQVRLLTKKE